MGLADNFVSLVLKTIKYRIQHIQPIEFISNEKKDFKDYFLNVKIIKI